MFFQGPVIFIAETLISFHIEDCNDYYELGDQENPNRSANPMEEEVIHTPIGVERYLELPIQLKIDKDLYSFKIKTNHQENTTPPPEHA
ncbi:hypothetical protein [Brumimicrobium mesophilum]|uniref:hypothetical protein n=1 Tax=Brumimicrobium mesophilum TaxID=392717 RepID=UPI00131AD4FA|nr:hypothetical protein [Brumimicrobium mesophilum]